MFPSSISPSEGRAIRWQTSCSKAISLPRNTSILHVLIPQTVCGCNGSVRNAPYTRGKIQSLRHDNQLSITNQMQHNPPQNDRVRRKWRGWNCFNWLVGHWVLSVRIEAFSYSSDDWDGRISDDDGRIKGPNKVWRFLTSEATWNLRDYCRVHQISLCLHGWGLIHFKRMIRVKQFVHHKAILLRSISRCYIGMISALRRNQGPRHKHAAPISASMRTIHSTFRIHHSLDARKAWLIPPTISYRAWRCNFVISINSGRTILRRHDADGLAERQTLNILINRSSP